VPHGAGKTPMFIFKLIVSVIMNMVIFGGLLLWPAGTLAWWRAWVFLGVVFVGTVATMVGVFAGREDLLNERFKSPIQKGQPLADKIVVVLFIVKFLGLIVFIPLDVFLFHPMGKPGAVVSPLGLVLFIAGWWIVSLSFKENPFAVPAVRLQEESNKRSSISESTAWCDIRCMRVLSSCWSVCPCGWNRTPLLCWRAFRSGCLLCGSWSRNSS
jgi:protein-S-isoprenylcysteine O-methyltransferase Ste14